MKVASADRAREELRDELWSGRFILFSLPGGCPAKSKERIFNDQPEELWGAIVSFSCALCERIEEARLTLIEASAERKDDELFKDAWTESLMTPERLRQLDRTLKGLLTEEDPSLIDWFALIKASPRPDRVKTFESKTDRIHVLVAGSAGRICSVLLETDPERRVLVNLFNEPFDIWRGRRRRAAEERL